METTKGISDFGMAENYDMKRQFTTHLKMMAKLRQRLQISSEIREMPSHTQQIFLLDGIETKGTDN